MYTSSLWSSYNQSSLNRLKVTYNNIMRRIAHVAPWQSASHMFGSLGVKSFGENLRISSYSVWMRMDSCPNLFMVDICGSDAALWSRQRRHWRTILF